MIAWEGLPFKIAVTGTMGSGKSLVGTILKDAGVPVVDADQVVHQLLNSDEAVRNKIRQRFGSAVFCGNNDNAEIARSELGKIVFDDAQARNDLENIVHPAVRAYCRDWIGKQSEPIVAVLIPLLFEAGEPQSYDEIWSVVCDEPVLRERIKQRNGFSDEEINKRLSSQLPQAEKAKRANRVINNSGSKAETTRQVYSLLEKVRSA